MFSLMNGRWPSLNVGHSAVIATVFILVGMTGCESFRIHDEGRLKISQEAAEAAGEMTVGGGAVFGPMEENLDAIKESQSKLRDLTNKHEYETFKPLVPSLGPDEIGRKLLEAMAGRQVAFQGILNTQETAARSVNEALDRQGLLADAIDAKNPNKQRTLEQTLERTQRWVDWIDTGIQRFTKAQGPLEGAAGTSELSNKLAVVFGGLTENAKTSAAVLGDMTSDAQIALDGIEEDEPLNAAKQLLLAAIQQTAAAEQARLLEFRRHLSEVQRIANRHRVRDKISVCNLFVTALGNMYYIVVDVDLKKELAEVTKTLRDSDRYNADRGSSCLPQLKGDETNQELKDLWVGQKLDAYVAANFAKANSDPSEENLDKARSASEFVGSLGILLFHERQMFEDTRLELAREQHRHSILFSRTNAGQRADLVHQLVQGLAIYYQGGVKPQEVTQLLLLATQVGGTFFIGSQL